MRKLSLLLAALLALLSLAPALADAAGEPILFRGIEWGTTLKVISEDVELSRVEDRTDAWLTPDGIRHGVSKGLKYPDWRSYTIQKNYSTSEVEAIGEIEGYRLLDVKLYFVCVPDADGAYIRDDAHAVLYAARYDLAEKPIDPELEGISVLNDLSGKLSGLYGAYEAELGTNGGNTCYTWHGADDTMVSLTMNPNLWAVNCITYSWGGAEALLEQAQQAQDVLNGAQASD